MSLSRHDADEVVLVLSNAPDAETAQRIARRLVEGGQAACVNVGAPMRSIYRWQGEVESADEIPLFIKTTAARLQAVREAIAGLHPYEVPEIIAVPITEGLPAYLDWVRQETQN
ncbi:divalent-cation tolerance protein CutA [Pigmentiphaga sp. NML080357]|uniref:divalent-cation tolerance protein CutA n=1 Tax=Pigmentiphaga sp. NML080357 TaxID=2008675 RepID=UPI000B40BD82|nr:divalent-cation tolerance protein CutA [Pigmentiphaga sp. NML080357]OVZ60380.1 divalent-cation tolerance protein CutA [Pigmentiphaga sp. NML080357]